MIKFVKINETYIRMICEPHILHEVSPHFDFYAKNYQYHPLVKSGKWDGVTRLMSNKTGRFYVGLLKVVILKCKELGYSQFSFEGFEDSTSEWVENDVLTLIDEFKLPDGYILREYQLYAILTCLLGVRRLCLAATNSGKSLIQYVISRVLLDANKKVLIIVPSVFLVDQIYKDFRDYAMADSFSVEDNYHKIFAGQAKTSDKMCYISTYHSLNSIPKDELSGYLENFDSILCDEVHGADSKSISSIMDKATNAKYRFGFTGTLKDCATHLLSLEGMFGSIKKIVTTKELIDAGQASKLTIKCIILKYPDEIRKLVSTMDYAKELDTVVGYRNRNTFIANLADKLEGNTLTLIRFIEKHANVLKDLYDAKNNKKTYLLTGETDKDIKMEIKEELEKVTNTNLMGSYGLLSTGISIINLNNLIFASPTKSKVRTLQSIGRMLRKGKNKTNATVYDIVDDLRFEGKPNFLMNHFKERYNHYKNEGFFVEIIEINIG